MSLSVLKSNAKDLWRKARKQCARSTTYIENSFWMLGKNQF